MRMKKQRVLLKRYKNREGKRLSEDSTYISKRSIDREPFYLSNRSRIGEC